jgi:hypothetical protein
VVDLGPGRGAPDVQLRPREPDEIPHPLESPQVGAGRGETGPRSFYIGYVDIAWQGGILVFERAFWRALRGGASSGAAYDRALLSGFSPAMLTPNWWGSYDALATPPRALPRLVPGQRYV